MSTTDALFLEDYRDLREIWIALRADKQAGSGTIDDPFDGSTIQEASKPITLITKLSTSSPDNVIAIATCVAHGFGVGDVITISGVPSGMESYASVFRIFSVTTDTFRYRMQIDVTQAPPSGDATGGGMTCFRTVYRFDEVMRMIPAGSPWLGSLPASCTIHIGPGVFESNGLVFQYRESSAPGPYAFGWQVKSGQRIIGSGIDVTVLRLVNAKNPFQHTSLIDGTDLNGHDVLNGFEASDFTVDANLGGQPVPAGYSFAPVSCGAVGLWGNHIRLRRIRSINWGTQVTSECFVLSILDSPQQPGQCIDNVIEDCIVEQPALNNTHESSLIVVSGTDPSTIGFAPSLNTPRPAGFSRACAVRQCYVNCEYQADPVEIAALSYAGSGSDTIVTVTTLVNHNRSVNQWVIISGVETKDNFFNAFNGSFKIESKSDTTFNYRIPGLVTTTAVTLTGRMFVDRWSSMPIPIQSLARYPANDPNTKQVKLTTPPGRPHSRKPGQNVAVFFTGDSIFEGLPNGATAHGEARVPVVAVISPTELIYELAINPGRDPIVDLSNASIGTDFHAWIADVVERCIAINTLYGVYRDTHSVMYHLVRHNYFKDVVSGVLMNFNQGGMGPFAITGLAPVAGTDGRLAQLTPLNPNFEDFKAESISAIPHAVRVLNAQLPGAGTQNAYNTLADDTGMGVRYHLVRSSNASSLTYELVPATSDSPSNPSQVIWSKMFQAGLLVVTRMCSKPVSLARASSTPLPLPDELSTGCLCSGSWR